MHLKKARESTDRKVVGKNSKDEDDNLKKSLNSFSIYNIYVREIGRFILLLSSSLHSFDKALISIKTKLEI